MVDLKNVSVAKLAIAAAMAIVPAVLSYCKASDEASASVVFPALPDSPHP